MGYPTKIATCCYCGTRAALVLTGKHRHELSCSGCGAPLHDLKMLPKDRTGDREILHDRPRKSGKPRSQKPKKKKSPITSKKPNIKISKRDESLQMIVQNQY